MPSNLYKFKIQPVDLVVGMSDAFFPGGWITFVINTVQNQEGSNPVQGYNFTVQTVQSTYSAIGNENRLLQTIPQAVAATVEVDIAESSGDFWDWKRGIGADQIGEQYKLYYVQRKHVKFIMTQVPTKKIGSINAAGTSFNMAMPGFTMYSRTMNALEEGRVDSLYDDLSILAPDSSIYQDQNVKAKYFPSRAEGQGTTGYTLHNRTFVWDTTFDTLSAEPNVEMDELVGVLPTNRQQETYPVAFTSPTKLVHGQIGWLMDNVSPMVDTDAEDDSVAGASLEFEVKMSVVCDIIFFDRDEVHTAAIDDLD